MYRRLATILALVVALAGCGGTSESTAETVAVAAADPTDPCAGANPDPGLEAGLEPLTCDIAIALANERLGWLHWPVEAIEFHRSICPPTARCAMPLRQGWVIFSFWSGDPVMIHVGPRFVGDVETDEFVADEPESPPDWLLEELATPG